jgi:asparagine synthase (glutamine-hydrolysing)
MCGIVGSNQTSFDAAATVHSLQHRGVDYQNSFIQDGVFLGHTRLSIIDLDDEANQPMYFDEIAIVFNGEIYNYQKLKEKHGLNCKTQSDTEVIIRLYQKYGKECVNLLDGMFAFCLYDFKEKSFFCARDRFGKKPFYYFFEDGKFYFASEIKAIIKMLGFTPKMDKQALFEYLVYQTPLVPNTFYEGIKKLSASNTLSLHNSALTIQPYYSFNNLNTIYTEEKKVYDEIETLLLESVKKRLVGDVEVAVLLSGGLDSSLITALYSKLSNQKLHTFSIGYDTHKKYCELSEAKKVAQFLQTEHNEITIGKKEFLETIDAVLDHLDEPLADSACIPTYILSKHIHEKGFKVCLSGEGSDELFLGYDSYFDILKKEDQKTYTYQSRSHTFSKEQMQQLLTCDFEYPTHNIETNYNLVNSFTYIDFSLWIAEVIMSKVDRMSMAHSLELRAPFMDRKLVEYMLQTDSTLKEVPPTKKILKKIAESYLKNETIYRRKKGFSSPFIEWLYEEYGENILKLFLEVNTHLGLFDEKYLRFLFNEGKNGRSKQHIYSLFLFCKWYKRTYL